MWDLNLVSAAINNNNAFKDARLSNCYSLFSHNYLKTKKKTKKEKENNLRRIKKIDPYTVCFGKSNLFFNSQITNCQFLNIYY